MLGLGVLRRPIQRCRGKGGAGEVDSWTGHATSRGRLTLLPPAGPTATRVGRPFLLGLVIGLSLSALTCVVGRARDELAKDELLALREEASQAADTLVRCQGAAALALESAPGSSQAGLEADRVSAAYEACGLEGAR
jgi:hypothetical protein